MLQIQFHFKYLKEEKSSMGEAERTLTLKRLFIVIIVRKMSGMQNGQMVVFNASVANFSADR